ncbi:MAG: phenylacetic acid degradation protein, partial [Anaerolineae bacterium]
MKYQVFTQRAQDAPHTHCGSVHAPDAEMALLLGRDVYTRRPQNVSLWVVPAEAVFARTAEQLHAWQPPEAAPDAPQRLFHVFCKVKPADVLTWQAEIRAPS